MSDDQGAPSGGEPAPRPSSADAPPQLALLINACGVNVGQVIDKAIRGSFVYGIAEGMELAAQVCEACVPMLAADMNIMAAVVAQQLRDLIRMQALQIEMPT